MSAETGADTGAVLPSTARALLHEVATAQVAARAPSLVAGVVRDGALVWSGGWGDVPGPVDDTQYRIGSITKTLTAVTVLQAVRDGLVDLEDRAATVVPELAEHGHGEVRLRPLLAHTSGLASEPTGEWWERTPGTGFAALLAANPGGPGAASVLPPGQQFHYTNLAYAILGEVVARLRGRPWWDVVRADVLEPLGMRRTTYLPVTPWSTGWSVHPYEGTLTPEPATDTGAMAPAGQAWSTVADLARYAAFLAAGDDAVLPSPWLDLASHPVGGTRHARLSAAHGLGLQLLRGGSGVLRGHLGSMPGFQAACLVDAPRRTGAVLLASSTTGTATAEVATRLLDVLAEREPTLPRPWRPAPRDLPAPVRDVVGVWHWGNTPYVVAVEGDDQQVVVRRGAAAVHRFAVVDGALVGVAGYHEGETLHVRRRPDGSVSHLEVSTFVWTRTPYDPDAPAPGGHPDAGASHS
ncbi:serine hydrolase domain-containing protein [Nocardioides zeae]|uniref:Serine hydrolase domain-containing protein n=1 Tax=Nocardioides imazamoxiresistens TaxID=3231893 RepID=A0ABU3PT47_9ACTN|nr:serine hydrolase domain-containing protein [Nocardioides zeae]MDT9592388.1 serine hydrolase domain-containing protein [Nocardioides zeae]